MGGGGTTLMNIHEIRRNGGERSNLKKKKKLGWGWIPETNDVDLYSGITRNIHQIVGD